MGWIPESQHSSVEASLEYAMRNLGAVSATNGSYSIGSVEIVVDADSWAELVVAWRDATLGDAGPDSMRSAAAEGWAEADIEEIIASKGRKRPYAIVVTNGRVIVSDQG